MKTYIDGIGYVDATEVGLSALPRKAIYFCSRERIYKGALWIGKRVRVSQVR